MQNALLTRWQLTPEEKFEDFLRDLVKYLKKTMVPYELPNGEIIYTCTQYETDSSYMELPEWVPLIKGKKGKNFNSYIFIKGY